MASVRFAIICLLPLLCLSAQEVKPKDVREVAKGGSAALPDLQQYLKNPSPDVRSEAVRQITDIGSGRSIDPLIEATRDNDPQIQMLATDGLVNFYSPGYIKGGIEGQLRRVSTTIRGKFTDTNDLVIDPYVQVRPEVIEAIGKLVVGGASMDCRANAAHALGILRGRAALDQLIEGVHSKDTDVIYESIVAVQKIRDQSAGPRVMFRLHDLDSKVQIAAIETMGLLLVKESLPGLVDVLNHARDAKVKREALTSIAMLPAESSRPLYAQYLKDKDDKLRAAAAEGYARLRNPADRPMLEQAWKDEPKASPRLSLAFALVMVGDVEMTQFSPLQFLVNNLNSAAYHDVAFPFLVELARDSAVRLALAGAVDKGTRDEKIGLAGVFGRSGDSTSIPILQRLSRDTDPQVAQEGLRDLRILQSRL